MLNISSQGVKNRILVLLRMGLLRRKRVYRKDSTMLVRFLTTDKGKDAIASHKKM
jgi:predicted DNA-binding transcriptional regulator